LINEIGVVFMDDTDFFANGKDAKANMEKILKE